jgi:predicted nucleic acid-binding protein
LIRVIDTSAWIERLIRSPTGQRLTAEFPAAANCVVPTIVQLELAKWACREFGPPAVAPLAAFTAKCTVIELDTDIALLAASLCRDHKLATADAVIYATALVWNIELLTCDAHFNGLPDVIYVPKYAPTQP